MGLCINVGQYSVPHHEHLWLLIQLKLMFCGEYSVPGHIALVLGAFSAEWANNPEMDTGIGQLCLVQFQILNFKPWL